jgi:hypothetical protein
MAYLDRDEFCGVVALARFIHDGGGFWAAEVS